jgi:twitching motility protein PilT
VQTVNRIIDVFPPHQQGQIRVQLSFVLEGVVNQQLVSRVGGPGRILACEVMVPTPGIRNLIKENKVHQIYSQMQAGQGKHGMMTFNQSLYILLQRRLISREEALGRSSSPDELESMLSEAKK